MRAAKTLFNSPLCKKGNFLAVKYLLNLIEGAEESPYAPPGAINSPFRKRGEARLVLEYVESGECVNTPQTCKGYFF
jgi:hypothetical protein